MLVCNVLKIFSLCYCFSFQSHFSIFPLQTRCSFNLPKAHSFEVVLSTRRKLQFKFLNFSAFLCFIQLFNCINILQALTASVKRLTQKYFRKTSKCLPASLFLSLGLHWLCNLFGSVLVFHGVSFLLTVSKSNSQKGVWLA